MYGHHIQVLSLNDLNRSKVIKIIERSFDGEFKVMDDDTMCLFDISRYLIDDLCSLIIQDNGLIYYSKLTTKVILEEFSKSFQHFHYHTYMLASKHEYHQKIPYIIGDRCIIPLDGYTKKTVTWIVASKIAWKKDRIETNSVELVSQKNVVLKIGVHPSVFEKQLNRTTHLLKEILQLFNIYMMAFRHKFREIESNKTTIISEKLKENSYQNSTTTMPVFMKDIDDYKTNQIIQRLKNDGYILEDEDIDY